MKGREKTKETEVMGTVLEIVIVNDYRKWINSIFLYSLRRKRDCGNAINSMLS
jgi:hypothetical protein